MSYSYRTSKGSSISKRYARSKTGARKSGNRGRAGKYIDPSRFVKVARDTTQEAYTPVNSFSDFAIDDLLHKNLTAMGYQTPSPIQDQAIPVALEGNDIIGVASTGTGKTAAFALPLLHKLMTNPKSAALIIAPTRELAQQIDAECRKLGRGIDLYGAVLIGGVSIGGQLRDLRQRPRLIIGTPGRIKDHLNRGSLRLQYFDTIVLDEVDRMLDMGFVHDVTSILEHMNPNKQSMFFSATLDNRVSRLIDTFTHNPVTVSIKASSTSDNVHQDVIRYQAAHDKMTSLHDVLIKEEVSKVIIFDETQRSVERLSKELNTRGFTTEAIHGGKSQGQRQRALTKFKKTEVNILVATDVAARGIDVADITHVINFSIPKEYDDYIHRIGRAGRAGKIGQALTFVPY